MGNECCSQTTLQDAQTRKLAPVRAVNNSVDTLAIDIPLSLLPTPQKVVLGYWKMRGLAQPIRYLLAYLEVRYEEKLYEMGDAPGYSTVAYTSVMDNLQLDFPDVLYFMDNEIKVTQPLAIIKYVALKYGPDSMLGSTDETKAEVEMLAHIIHDLLKKTNVQCYITHAINFDRVQLGALLVQQMEELAHYVGSHKKEFLVGADPTFPDFMLFELCERIQFISEGILLMKYPALHNYINHVALLPQIARYMQFNKNFNELPFNNKNAIINDRH